MKTVAEIQALIDDIDGFWKDRTDGLKKYRTKDARLRKFYYKVKLYLETNPREQFLHNMKDDRERHINHIVSIITHKLLEDLYPKLNYRKARNQFLKDNDVPGMKDMIKTIDFILN